MITSDVLTFAVCSVDRLELLPVGHRGESFARIHSEGDLAAGHVGHRLLEDLTPEGIAATSPFS